jgi:hypothetical protein
MEAGQWYRLSEYKKAALSTPDYDNVHLVEAAVPTGNPLQPAIKPPHVGQWRIYVAPTRPAEDITALHKTRRARL